MSKESGILVFEGKYFDMRKVGFMTYTLIPTKEYKYAWASRLIELFSELFDTQFYPIEKEHHFLGDKWACEVAESANEAFAKAKELYDEELTEGYGIIVAAHLDKFPYFEIVTKKADVSGKLIYVMPTDRFDGLEEDLRWYLLDVYIKGLRQYNIKLLKPKVSGSISIFQVPYRYEEQAVLMVNRTNVWCFEQEGCYRQGEHPLQQK